MSLLLLFGGGFPASTSNPSSGTFPGLTIEIAFGSTWHQVPSSWTDVTQWVELSSGIDITTGRADEIQPFDASTCSLTLNNMDRRFDPSYAAGPYFGDILPLVPLRVLANWDGQNYPLFYGFIEGWPQTSRVGDELAPMRITANDVLELLAQTDFTSGSWTLDDDELGRLDAGNRIGGEGSLSGYAGERVEAILDLAGVPDEMQNIATGVALLTDDLLDGTPRSALQTIETAEGGYLYAGPDGIVYFYARDASRTVARMSTSQGTFSDQDLDLPYAGLEYAFDRKYVYNDVRRSRVDGSPQVATDDDSIDRYSRRKHEVSDLPLASDSDAAALAGLFLLLHAEPVLRPAPLVVDPGNNRDTLYPQVLGRQLLDRVTVERTPQQVGSGISEDYRIEGITHQIRPFSWMTTWPLSPVDDTTYWTLDDDALGLLDSGNLIGA